MGAGAGWALPASPCGKGTPASAYKGRTARPNVALTARKYSPFAASIWTMPAFSTPRTSSPLIRPAPVGGPDKLVQVAADGGQLPVHRDNFQHPILKVVRTAREGFAD